MELPKQTPLYYANNISRYQRQDWIKLIEEQTGRRLIVYMSFFDHPRSSITRDDIIPINDILSDIDKDNIDLILHSPGGDPNAAEQLINILLARSNNLRIIVPLSAKSAATMMCLAADEIIMSDSSELGPIDPQVPFRNPSGFVDYRPAQAFLKGIEDIKEQCIERLNPAYFPILQNIDPAFIYYCKKSIDHTRNIAIKWLLRSMCKNDENKAESIADALLNLNKYPNHGQVINWEEAKNLGLNVLYLNFNDNLWQLIWRLSVIYQNEMKKYQIVKIYESRDYSTAIQA